MWLLIAFCSVLSSLAIADGYKLDPSRFSFEKNQPVHVFEFPQEGDGKRTQVCCGSFSALDGSVVEISVSVVDDLRDCQRVDAFGENDLAFLQRSVLAGRQALFNSRPCSGREKSLSEKEKCESEQVKIKGKIWSMSDAARTMVTRLNPSDNKLGLNHVCRLQLRPLQRIFEKDAPTKTLFCKPISPIRVQDVDLDGKFIFDKQNRPVMIDTVVCPLPRDCVKPEWEIVPTMQFIPGVDDSTVHADTATSAVVHTGTRPAAK